MLLLGCSEEFDKAAQRERKAALEWKWLSLTMTREQIEAASLQAYERCGADLATYNALKKGEIVLDAVPAGCEGWILRLMNIATADLDPVSNRVLAQLGTLPVDPMEQDYLGSQPFFFTLFIDNLDAMKVIAETLPESRRVEARDLMLEYLAGEKQLSGYARAFDRAVAGG